MGKDVRRDIANRDLGRALGRKIARLERHLREVETASQAAYRSVEDGALDFYDDDGVLRERIGKQPDGSWGRRTIEGPIPPAPTEPDVQVISDGVVAITWDGRSEEKWPFVEFEAVRVHLVSDPDAEVCDRDNQVGAIFTARGGTIVAVTESDDDNPVYVRLVAVSAAGHTSDPSPAVLVDELDEEDLEEEPEELEWEDGDGHTLTTEDVAAGTTVTFGLSHIPEQESLIAFVGGVHQKPTSYSVDYEGQTLTWVLAGWEPVGARMSVQYPYFAGEAGLPASLAVWLSADYEATRYADGDSMANVTNLVDMSTIPAISGAEPTFRATSGPGGGPCWGTQQEQGFSLALGDLPGGTPTELEVLTVVKWMGTPGGEYGWWRGGATGSGTWSHYPFSDGKVYDDFAAPGRPSFTPTMSLDTWRRYGANNGPAGCHRWLDEVEQLSSADGFGLSAEGFLIGSLHYGGFGSDMHRWASVFLFNRQLSDAERAQVVAWATANPSGGFK